MSYTLPDEPRGAIRPELAVNPIWPLLTLMLIGPLPGFAWLGFNSLALGCRRAGLHLALAAGAIVLVPLAVVALVPATLGEGSTLAFRLALIVVQGTALLLALWLMMDQADAEDWRRTHGPAIGNGARAFFPLLVFYLLLGNMVPGNLRIWFFWVGA